MRFKYEEFDDSGRLLDKETGTFPELHLGLELGWERWFVAAELRYLQGTADYTAYPSPGTRLESETDEEVVDFSILLGQQIEFDNSTTLAVYGGLGYRFWSRDIQSIPGVFGLDEEYDWGYFLVGVSPVTELGPRDRLSIDLQFRKAFNASLDVRFKGDTYDSATLDLDDGDGLRLAFNWERQINRQYEFTLGPFIDIWDFDRSDDVDLERDGVTVGSLHEPASRTRVYGIRFFLTRRF